MEQFFADYLEGVKKVHDDIKKSLEGLSERALDWRPGDEMNSLCVIAVHVAGSERYWIGDIVAKKPTGRDRDAEFRAEGFSASQLARLLDGSLVYIEDVLSAMRLEDMGTRCVVPKDGREFTAGRVLFNLLAHVASHLGHAQLSRQLWGQWGQTSE